MPDPRKPDPAHPDRPDHPDFVRLSEIVQAHDALSEQLGLHPFRDILGIDEESFIYLVENRLGIWSQRTHRSLPSSPAGKAAMHALYMDAFALGQAYAGDKQEVPNSQRWGDNEQTVVDLMARLGISLTDLELWITARDNPAPPEEDNDD